MRTETIGKTTLYLCDCMDLLKTMPDKSIDLAICDPPYGSICGQEFVAGNRFNGGTWANKYKIPTEHIGHKRTENSKAYSWTVKYSLNKTHTWDVAPTSEYFQEIFRVSNYQIFWGGNYFSDKLPPSRNFIIWKKHIPESFTMAMCEYAWTNIPGNAKFYYHTSIDKDRFHPTQKPVALYKWLLVNYAKPGWKILDTHFGSGSIAIACNELGFSLTASEIDESYFNAAVERIKEFESQGRLFEGVI